MVVYSTCKGFKLNDGIEGWAWAGAEEAGACSSVTAKGQAASRDCQSERAMINKLSLCVHKKDRGPSGRALASVRHNRLRRATLAGAPVLVLYPAYTDSLAPHHKAG